MDKIIALKNGKIDKILTADDIITYLEENEPTNRIK